MSAPKTQLQVVNGKRTSPHRTQDFPTISQHDDLIKYIYDSWNKVSREFEHFSQSRGENAIQNTVCPSGGPCVLYYAEQEPNPKLKDFRPFDLEAWWGQRLVQNITRTQSSSSSS